MEVALYTNGVLLLAFGVAYAFYTVFGLRVRRYYIKSVFSSSIDYCER